jgi:hypothetical protein
MARCVVDYQVINYNLPYWDTELDAIYRIHKGRLYYGFGNGELYPSSDFEMSFCRIFYVDNTEPELPF